MKTTKRFLYFAAVSSLLFAACNRETVAPEENVTPGENNGGTYLVYFGAEAALDDAATGSKATLTEDVTEAGKAIFRSAWENGDQAYMQYQVGTGSHKDFKPATWSVDENAFAVNFTVPDVDPAIEEDWNYYLLYPYSNSTFDLGSQRVQTGNKYNSNYDVMYGNVHVDNGKLGYDGEERILFNMKRETGIAYFHFTSDLVEDIQSATLTTEGGNIAGTIALKSANIYDGFHINATHPSITITFDSDNVPKSNDFCLWFNVLPTDYTSLSLRVFTTDHEFTLKKSTADSYDKAKLYKVEKSGVIWKERVAYNVITNVTSGEGTITATPSSAYEGTLITLSEVHDNDKYIFDGYTIECPGYDVSLSDDNTFIMPPANVTVKASFTSKGSDDSSIELSKDGFANCYIVSGAGDYKFLPTKGNSTTALSDINSVEVLWESFGTDVTPAVGDLLKDVTYENNYISFTTTGNAGNALIAAKNADGVILWSWHIWLTDIPVEKTLNDAIIQDRNLGAISVDSKGLYYQWGRKDPFLFSDWASSTNLQSSETSANLGTINKSIENPTVFIKYNYKTYDWLQVRDTNLWGSKKTVYDPCPLGYKVASKSVFGDTSSYSKLNNLYYFNDITFPMSGYIKYLRYTFEENGTAACYWTSDGLITNTNTYECIKLGSSAKQFASNAFSVRCQKE